MADNAQRIVFHRNDVGRVFVEEWPELTEVSAVFLDNDLPVVDPKMMRRSGDRLYLSVENGNATYILQERSDEDLARGVYRAARLYADLRPGAGS